MSVQDSAVSTANVRPYIVGLGGTARPNSSSERALRYALQAAEALGATTEIFVGAALDLPMYNPENTERSENARVLIDALRRADGIVLASPGYHGSLSGMVKNALDYVEDMRGDEKVYFQDRPVACIVTAAGWQTVGSTLGALRAIVHALRGWPTPLGVGINSLETNPAAAESALDILAREVVGFASKHGSSGVAAAKAA